MAANLSSNGAGASQLIVQKLWNYCNVLRDDGLSYGDYVEQLTYLLFLKMADERGTPLPDGYTWRGLCMLMRTIAVELAPHQITVNNIGPGAIDTPMDAPLKAHPEQMRALLAEIPIGRMGKPEEVAELAVYLASDAAGYVTGSTFFIDGGMLRQSGSL